MRHVDLELISNNRYPVEEPMRIVPLLKETTRAIQSCKEGVSSTPNPFPFYPFLHQSVSPPRSRSSLEGGPNCFSPNHKEARFKKKGAKCIRARGDSIKMTVGFGIPIAEVTRCMGKLLVGRFFEKIMGDQALQKWLAQNWELVLGYVPEAHVLPRS